MAETFELEVATPDRLLVKDQVTEAQIPAATGYVGVLPEHAPLLAELGSGLLTYSLGGKTHSVVVSGGVLEVLPTHVRVLTLTAERPDEIDLKRAKEALDRAERRLKEAGDWDIPRALGAAARARARMEAASKSGR
jgi:F-type H+-transporting ATPase subunit epsilon